MKTEDAATPPAPPEIILCSTLEALSFEAARIFADICRQRARQTDGGIFCALTGGRTPKRMYDLLTGPEYRETIPWGRLYLFWGDERHLPLDDPRSNAGSVLPRLHSVPIPKDHLLPIPTDRENPQEAAEAYARTLQEVLRAPDQSRPVFDLILLGLGEDGHIASLFPETAAPDETVRWVVSLKRDVEDFSRISLTLPVINQARRILFLVSGKEKAEIVKRIIQDPPKSTTLPARRVSPDGGHVTWLMDREAASQLALEKVAALGYRVTHQAD